MEYELRINLVGGENAAAILRSLSGLSSGLGSGGGTSKASRDISDIARSVASGQKFTSKMASDLDKISASGQKFSSSMREMMKNPSVAAAFSKQFPKEYQEFINSTTASSSTASAIQQNAHINLFKSWLKSTSGKFTQMQGPDLNGEMRQKVREKWEKQMLAQSMAMGSSGFGMGIDWKKAALGGVSGIFNPWIGSRILSDVFKGAGGGGGGGGVAKGIFGAGGAMGFTEFYLGFKLLQKALESLRYIVLKTAEAYETARKLYAKALTSGMGLQFTAKRSLMAEIMGVSETEVFRFGAQMNYLNEKLKFASDILSKTATPLTAVSYEFKVLENDLSAMFATLAEKAAPSILQFTQALEVMVQVITKLINAASEVWKYAKWLPSNIILRSATGEFTRDALYKILGIKSDGGLSGMPAPQAWMRQMSASSIERMGFVTMGGGMNYQKDIAKNTRQTAVAVTAMAKAIAGAKGGAGAAWNMLPFVNNP